MMNRAIGIALAVVGLCALAARAQDSTAVTSAMVKPQLNHEAMEKLGWKLSVQVYTLREMSLFEAIDVAQSLGVRYIEMYPEHRFSKEKPDVRSNHNMTPEQIAELKQKLGAANIKPVAYGVVGLPNNEAGSRKVFEFAKTMGIEVIVSEPEPAAFDLIDKLSQEYGIRVALHNHPRPSRYFDPDTVLKACEGRSKSIGACADTGHWYRSGFTPVDCIKKLEGRIVSFHFKDLSAERRDVPWGTGVCDAKGMLAEVKRQGFKGIFSIEYESGRGPALVSNVAKCLQFFSDTAVELAGK
jgi:sugar phosphate isomerase/epimerase